jgi:ABC-type nickel/cobalt efflux system permease component RcnA
MESGVLVAIEGAAIFGLVLGFGVWQLWSLKRDNARAKAEEDAKRARQADRTASEKPDA